MQKLKDLFKEHKRISIVMGGCVLVLIIVLIIVCFTKDDKKEKDKPVSNEEELVTLLTKEGRKYYEDFYFVYSGSNDKERIKALKERVDTGISSDLDNIARSLYDDSSELLDKFVNSQTNEKCDMMESKVLLIPKEPFGQKDYDIKVTLECGF